MNWTTLYITGRTDFREDVRRKLESSRLKFMPGYIDSSVGYGNYDLYWVDEKADVREFKEAVGSKLVWKYRLRFYLNLEEFLQSVNGASTESEFSSEEKDLLTAMRRSA